MSDSTLTPLTPVEANTPLPAPAPLPPVPPVPFTPIIPTSEAVLPPIEAPLTMPMTVGSSSMEEHVKEGFFDIEAYIKKEVGKGITEYNKLKVQPVVKGSKFSLLDTIFVVVVAFVLGFVFVTYSEVKKPTPVIDLPPVVVAPVKPSPAPHTACHKSINKKPSVTNLGD